MVRPVSVEARRSDLPSPLVMHCSSAGLGWHGLFSSFERAPAIAGRAATGADERIILHRSGLDIRWRNARQWNLEHVVPGTVHLIPGGTEFEVDFDDDVETQTIIIGREILVEVASEFIASDPSKLSLRQSFYAAPMPQLHLFQSIGAAVASEDPGWAVYAEYAARAVAAQLLSAWSTDHGRVITFPPRRGRSRTVPRAMDFMQSNLGAKLTLEIIGQAVGVSVTKLCREFRSDLDMAPHQALVELRLKRAQHLLQHSKVPLLDIADQCGFSSQEHMTGSFRTRFGLTPRAYRRSSCEA